ncbi:hypothetical protein LTR85_009023 [Meristemomyces frigidus]|nr:hypothetical protein LTR85_009023 [Meristemomyces frigidus]
MEDIGSDPYYSGNFYFAPRGQPGSFGSAATPVDIIPAAEAGRIDSELCKQIFIDGPRL